MSHFDDMEDSRSRPRKVWINQTKKHFTSEEFEDGDGRFLIRKGMCGLERSQSSGMMTRKRSKVTCLGCLAAMIALDHPIARKALTGEASAS